MIQNTNNTRILVRETCILLYCVHGPPVFSILGVQVLTKAGAYVRTLGTTGEAGTGDQQFDHPAGEPSLLFHNRGQKPRLLADPGTPGTLWSWCRRRRWRCGRYA